MGAGILIFLLVLLPENTKMKHQKIDICKYLLKARNFKNYKFGTLEFDDAEQKISFACVGKFTRSYLK